MKKLFFLLLLPVILFWALPIPPANANGAYNSFSHTIWCSGELACIHEVGHKLDHESGWTSRKKEFSLAVQYYLYTELRQDVPSPLVFFILDSPGLFTWKGYFINTQAELYANIFEWSGGQEQNMPELFREFYNWKRAYNLMEKYVR